MNWEDKEELRAEHERLMREQDKEQECETLGHIWGEVEYARFTGNPHRKCQNCKMITDLEEDEDDD